MNDVCVAIRSVGERTEPLVYHACKTEVPYNFIYQIQGQSLSEGTRMACELAVSSGMKWVLFVGGDYVPRYGFIHDLREVAENVPDDVMFVKGVIRDKFLMEQRGTGGGPMLQRVDLLKEWLRNFDRLDNGRTTEAQFHRYLAEKGYRSERTKIYLACHDFHQHYKDIYRSCFVYGKKKRNARYLLPRWATMGVDDPDFRLCREAYINGLAYEGKVVADFRMDYGFKDTEFYGKDKPEIPAGEFDNLIRWAGGMAPEWV